MKAGQFQIVRWVSKLVAKPARTSRKARASAVRELDPQQLRQVAGGDGGYTLPNKGW